LIRPVKQGELDLATASGRMVARLTCRNWFGGTKLTRMTLLSGGVPRIRWSGGGRSSPCWQWSPCGLGGEVVRLGFCQGVSTRTAWASTGHTDPPIHPIHDDARPGSITGRASCCWGYASGCPRWQVHPHRRASNRPLPWGKGTSWVCLHWSCRSSYPGCCATAHSADMADVSTAGALTAPHPGSGRSPGPRPPTACPPP
jgi:hypothetical protein